jgi:hypothetical protein
MARVDEEMAMARMQAEMNGFPSTDSLLQQMFGSSMNESSYRSLLEFITTADSFSEHVRESFAYNPEALEAFYAESRDSLDVFHFRTFMVFAEDVEPDDFQSTEEYLAAVEDSLSEANAIARGIIAGITSDDDFIAAAMEYDEEFYAEPDSTLRMLQGDRLNAELEPWLLDESREHGDIEVIDSDRGSHIVFFVLRDDNSYNVTGMRQILILRDNVDPEDFIHGEDDLEYIAALAQAEENNRERAEAVFALFTAVGETEEALLGLMEEHSDDTTEGGYYTNISRHPYQSAHVSAMKVGDTELVRTEAFGYHLLYFTGYGERFLDIIADDMKRTSDHNLWRDGLPDVLPVRHRAFVLVQV